MGATNYGTQTIIFDYKYPAKGRDFSKLFRGILKPGVYNGFTVTKTGDNTVSIAAGIIAIQSSTDKLVIVKTSEAFTLNVVDSAPVIYASHTWVDATGNYCDFLTRADTGKLTNEVQLCTVNFSGGVITTIDYADKDWGTFDGSFNMYLSSTLYVDTITEKTTGNGVDIEDINITDDDIDGVDTLAVNTINETTTDNGVTIDGTNIKDGILTDDGSSGVGIQETGGEILRHKIINIGDWDMSTATGSATKAVDCGNFGGYTKIRAINVLIRDDSDSEYTPLNIWSGAGVVNGGWVSTTGSPGVTVSLSRLAGGYYDGVNFNSTSFNRGWVTIWYID